MKHITCNKKNIEQINELATTILTKGGLVVFPSDTVYGLLVDAANEKAVEKLIAFKNRPPGKATSVFVADFNMMRKYVEVSGKQEKVLKQLLPGPYTIILKSKNKVCWELESEKKTLGIRIPQYQSILDLVKKFGKPITATSANLSYQKAHYSIKSFIKGLPKEKEKYIDLVVDGGDLPYNKPSTVLDLTKSEIKVLRQGDLNINKQKVYLSDSETKTKLIAQEIFKRNLSPEKPLFIIIEGDLGVGKTIFVKGIGESLGIKNIISPSYVIYYEYPVAFQYIDILIHVDLYNVENQEEFKHLGLEKYFKKGNILCFEWGEKMGELYETLKSKGKVIYINMRYVNERKREIIFNF